MPPSFPTYSKLSYFKFKTLQINKKEMLNAKEKEKKKTIHENDCYLTQPKFTMNEIDNF